MPSGHVTVSWPDGIAVTLTAETVNRRAGALRSLRPQLGVPPAVRCTLLTTGTAIVAIWALGGFYSSLEPALVHLVAPEPAPPAADRRGRRDRLVR